MIKRVSTTCSPSASSTVAVRMLGHFTTVPDQNVKQMIFKKCSYWNTTKLQWYNTVDYAVAEKCSESLLSELYQQVNMNATSIMCFFVLSIPFRSELEIRNYA